jgi:hypothetical protein
MVLPSYEDYQVRQRERQRRIEEKKPTKWWWFKQRDPIARFTLYVGIFTLLLVGVGGLQTWTLLSQLWETQIEQRPWIYTDVPIIPKPLKENINAVWELPIKFTIHNVGHLPAYVYSWVKSPVPVINHGNLIEEYQSQQCVRKRNDQPAALAKRFSQVKPLPEKSESEFGKGIGVPCLALSSLNHGLSVACPISFPNSKRFISPNSHTYCPFGLNPKTDTMIPSRMT